MRRKIKKVGNLSPSGHGGGNIYSINGLCPTLTANDFKHPKWIVVSDEEED